MAASKPREKQVISVIIPIYNAEPYLKKALESLCQQSYPHLEILCLDDGCTDNSPGIVRDFAEKDPRIKLIRKHNQGYGATCNLGIDMAQGEWIAILEPDDWIEGEMFEEMLAFSRQFLPENNDIDIIKSSYWRIIDADTPQQKKEPCGYLGMVNPRPQPFTIARAPHLLDSHPSIWTALYRKEFLLEKQIRFREYPGAGWADNPFLIETLCQAGKIIYLDKAFYCYREDSADKVHAFTKANPVLPLDRWNEMMDFLEKKEIRDPDILKAHYRRGIAYINVIENELGSDNCLFRKAIRETASRMNSALVLKDVEIPRELREEYACILGMPKPSFHPAREKAQLFVHNVRTRGIQQTAESIIRHFSH